MTIFPILDGSICKWHDIYFYRWHYSPLLKTKQKQFWSIHVFTLTARYYRHSSVFKARAMLSCDWWPVWVPVIPALSPEWPENQSMAQLDTMSLAPHRKSHDHEVLFILLLPTINPNATKLKFGNLALYSTHWSSSRDWTFFLYQAFRPCQKFCMTCRKILRCVTTFSLGNFRR